MKIIGRKKDVLFSEKGLVISFEVPQHYHEVLGKIDTERLLEIDIKDKKSQRTLNQNALLWQLIHTIDIFENGHTDKESEMNLYTNLIKMAKIRIDYLQSLPEAKETLLQVYRVVEDKDRRTSEKGVETVVFACYRGTSQFTTEEMSDFIDTVIAYAHQIDMHIPYYEQELR